MIPGSANPLLLAPAAGGYQVSRSLRFNSADSAYLSRTPAVAGNRRTWTWAGWVKRSALTSSAYSLFAVYADGSNRGYISYQGSTDKILLFSRVGGSDIYEYSTNAVFRDASAWYHVVVAFDTTQATASNRLKIYVNGVEQAITASTTVSQNTDTYYNTTQPHYIGYQGGGDAYYSGYLADIHFIDGQALTPSSFTEVSATTGQLIPLAYSGSFGTNGFWLKFSDNSAATAATLGKDYSGNSNNWTPNNLSVTAGAGNDSPVDTPTSYGTDTGVGGEVRGNYCTWNATSPIGASFRTFTNGNLDCTFTNGSNTGVTLGTIYVNTGKWYCEYVWNGVNDASVGIASLAFNSTFIGAAESYSYRNNGQKRANGTAATYGATWTTGDVLGVALNLDAGELTFYKNGVSQSVAYSGLSGTFTFGASSFATAAVTANFGQRAFAYTAPSGFKALCDTNLGAPLIAKPNQYFGIGIYSGNNGSNTITTGIDNTTNAGLLWIKGRSIAAVHNIIDKVRGYTNLLELPLTAAEYSYSINLAETSTGYTLNTGSGQYNSSGDTYVAWNWAAGTSTVSNTAGSITSQVRANVSAGFSVATYTGNAVSGATVGHGLGVAPQLIIIKSRVDAYDWIVYHASIGNTGAVRLNTTAATQTTSTWFNNSGPSSTTFTLGNTGGTNESGSAFVAYAFAPVVGYSSFGSYTGNGSASDGPFVYTGFRPKWILVKRTDSADDWPLMDTVRTPANPQNAQLWPNFSNAESSPVASSRQWDALSNGFKLRGDNGAINASAGTYIFAAVAENPFQYARAR